MVVSLEGSLMALLVVGQDKGPGMGTSTVETRRIHHTEPLFVHSFIHSVYGLPPVPQEI
jgi:hypothetical protein